MINSVNTSLRPINIAFLIDVNDKKALQEVIEMNTYLWGGVYNSVIPVYKRIPTIYKQDYYAKKSIDVVKDYLKSYDPDYVVNLSQLDTNLIKDDFAHWQIVEKKDLMGKYAKDAVPAIGIGMDEILHEIRESEFKYVRSQEVPMLDIKIPARYALFYSAVFGKIDNKVWPRMIEAYGQDLGFKTVDIKQNDYYPLLRSKHWFLRRLSNYTLRSHYDGLDDTYINLIDANSWHDIVDYLNLRATGATVFPVLMQTYNSKSNLKYLREIIDENTSVNEFNKEIVYRPSLLKGRSIAKSTFDNFTKQLGDSYPPGEKPQLVVQSWYPPVWNSKFLSGYKVTSVKSKRQSFPTAEANIEVVKPKIGWKRGYRQQTFANDISFDVYGGEDYYAKVLATTDIAPSHLIGTYSYDQWRISKRGLVFLASSSDAEEAVNFTIPKAENLFASWLKKQTGKNIALSTPGKVAKQMLKKLGRPEGINILTNEGLLELMQKTVGDGSSNPTLSYKGILGELNKIANKDKRRDAKTMLANLIRIGALELGVETQCPNCDKHNWYPLNKLDNTLTCEKCLDDYEVVRDNPDKEMAWTYSLAGPFRLPNMADGAFTTLLSLYFLGIKMRFSITPHLSFTEIGNSDYEADFGMLIENASNYNDSQITGAFGECKSFYHPFKERDVNRLKEIAKDYDNPLLIFSTLRKELTPKEKGLLLKLLNQQRKARIKGKRTSRLLILTGNELLMSEYSLSDQWEKLTPAHKSYAKIVGHARIDELCDATQVVYLGSQSEGDWLHQVLKTRRETKELKEIPKSI